MTKIDSSDDPKLTLYIAMKDRDIRRETGLFLAEGEHLVRRAFEAELAVRSVLVIEQKVARVKAMLADAQAESVEVLACTKQVLADTIGFALHQGMVAAVEPPSVSDGIAGLDQVVRACGDKAAPTLLVCPEITNVENLGLLARVAAGLILLALLFRHESDEAYQVGEQMSCVHDLVGRLLRLPLAGKSPEELGFQPVAETPSVCREAS